MIIRWLARKRDWQVIPHSSFLEDQEAGCGDHHEAGNVVPLQPLLQVENRKDGENGQADNLLDRL